MTKTKTATWLLLGSGLAVGTIGAILLLTPETENAQVLVGPSSVGVRVRF